MKKKKKKRTRVTKASGGTHVTTIVNVSGAPHMEKILSAGGNDADRALSKLKQKPY